MNGFRKFLIELKRRKVYRAAVVYAVAALAVVEAADLTLPRLGFADSTVTFILIASLLGLPLALVLAWAYETTPEGVKRTAPADASTVSGSGGSYAAAVAAVVVVAGIGWWLVSARADDHGTAGSGATEAKSIAVLPFRDMSPDGDQKWFGEGLAEEMLGALARVPDLRVVARQSSFALADATIREIGERLGVTHVLSGSVRTEGTRARIRAQLTEVESQRDLWSKDFQPELASVLDAQEEIARTVVDRLEVELGLIGDATLMRASTTIPAAHENYLRGLQLWNRRSEPDILLAIDHFREAVELDSTYAAAWAGLSYAYLVLPEYSPTTDVERVRDQSELAATRALSIDPEQPDALTAMGWGRMIHYFDWQGAEELIARGLAMDSTNVNALHWQSHVLSWQGRSTEAVALARKATELDPLSSVLRSNLGYILMEAREYDEALGELERALSTEPGFDVSYRITWNVNTRAGRYEAAAAALDAWLVRTGREAAATAELAREFSDAASRFARNGQPGTLSRELVDRLQLGLELAGQLYGAVGDREMTLMLLEQAFRERAGARSVLSVKVNPLYDFLRDDPSFQDLVRRVGLGGQQPFDGPEG